MSRLHSCPGFNPGRPSGEDGWRNTRVHDGQSDYDRNTHAMPWCCRDRGLVVAADPATDGQVVVLQGGECV